MAGRAKTLAAAVVTALAAWGDLPSGVTVSRVRNVTHLIADLPPATPAVIAVIVANIDDQSSRGDVAEDVTLGIVIIANCESAQAVDSDSWDETTEKLRDYLRTSTTFKNMTVASGLVAQRRTVNTTVPCDADVMDESEVFVSVTEATWFISVGNVA
jgi:SepF-like predicted cell division protein (DUF552 family)